MGNVVDEGRIAGYCYAVIEVKEGEYIWWSERPGGTTCWRGNVHPVPSTVAEAKDQIIESLTKYGVNPPTSH